MLLIKLREDVKKSICGASQGLDERINGTLFDQKQALILTYASRKIRKILTKYTINQMVMGFSGATRYVEYLENILLALAGNQQVYKDLQHYQQMI